MFPHSYRDLFSHLISRGHLAPTGISATFWISPFVPNFAIFAEVANFAEIATRQGSTFALQIEWPDLWQKFAIFAKIAKIATFQGYTFDIQLAICMMTSFYYKDQNPSAVCFLVQIKAFVI